MRLYYTGLIAGFAFLYCHILCANPKVKKNIEGFVISEPKHFKSTSGQLESYSFKVKTNKGENVSVIYTTKFQGKALLGFSLKEGSAFKETGELAESTQGMQLKTPFLGSFYVNPLLEIKSMPVVAGQFKNAQDRLLGIFNALSAFKMEYDTYTSDFVAAGVTLMPNNPYVCGFSQAIVVNKSDAEKITKAERFNDTFLDPQFKILPSQAKSWLSQIPRDAVASELAFKVFCVNNLDVDSDLDIWSIDDNKKIVHVKTD